MLLKHLELTGFKSFVDSTRLDFTQGFTAVVGPNGCGKSNISDAIRWVIGEQSSKNLRGTRITDLIFNGSSSRKPVHRAEITITLGNVPEGLRIANIQNLSDEIKVTRCYHRSGESEFYINQIPCRLKDITDLFLDVGISPKVLTVIEQNHIQDIVTSKPEDRRIWIEEAAGILKFKVRKNEALRKLETAGQNLDRISDIVQELSRQVESLKRQAAKAERYKQFQSEIKELSLNLFSKRIRKFQQELEQITEILEEENEQKVNLNAKSSTYDSQITELRLGIEELTKALNQKREQLQQLNDEIRTNEHNIELKKAQIDQAKKDIEMGQNEISQMISEMESHKLETEKQQNELNLVGEEIKSHEEKCEFKLREWEHGKGLLNELGNRIKSSESQLLDLFNKISQQKNQIASLETRQEFLKDREIKLQNEQKDTESQSIEIQTKLQKAESLFNEKKHHWESSKQNQAQMELELNALNSKLEILDQEIHSSKEAFLSQSSLFKSLKELRTKFEGFGEGVKALMSHANGDRPLGLKEVIVDVIKAPAEFEKAVEAVLGDRLQSIIVDSYSNTVDAIRYLREHKSGRGSFIPLQPKPTAITFATMNGNQGAIGKLSDFIETPEEYKTLLNMLLGNVVVVKDLETAFHIHHMEEFTGTVVTLNGEVIDSQGVVTGGLSEESNQGLLVQNREIDELGNQVEALNQALNTVVADKENVASSFSLVNENYKNLNSEIHEIEIEKNNRKNEMEQLQIELGRLEKKLSNLKYEQSNNLHEKNELSQELETIVSSKSQTEEEKQQLETLLQDLQKTSNEQRIVLDQQNEEINQIKVQMASQKGKFENIEIDIKRLQLQQENLKQRITLRESEGKTNKEKIESGSQAISEFENLILRNSEETEGLRKHIVQEEEIFKEKETLLNQLDQDSRLLSRQIQELTEAISKNELKSSELNLQISHIEERAWEDFNVTVDDILHTSEGDVDEEEVAEKLAALKDKVARIGEVNLAALSDFKVANERYLFLQKQQEDLAESILSLHQTVEKMDKTTKKLFLDTFEEVNEKFKSIFQRLFLGGKAELSLVDPEDPLETGIEITASPLGKSMHNITLLSGGEKSMTAIALVFAILKVRPSPFVLLDEVDAALDEANVVRFQEMLKEMSEKTQFIIITHNQKSMSFANTLYGVTMEERGVSKVVSVNLN